MTKRVLSIDRGRKFERDYLWYVWFLNSWPWTSYNNNNDDCKHQKFSTLQYLRKENWYFVPTFKPGFYKMSEWKSLRKYIFDSLFLLFFLYPSIHLKYGHITMAPPPILNLKLSLNVGFSHRFAPNSTLKWP